MNRDEAARQAAMRKGLTVRAVSTFVSASTEDVAADIDTNSFGPTAVASIASVGLALYFYYVRGDKQRGQFVGFWPVTILAFASFLKLEEIKELLEEN